MVGQLLRLLATYAHSGIPLKTEDRRRDAFPWLRSLTVLRFHDSVQPYTNDSIHVRKLGVDFWSTRRA